MLKKMIVIICTFMFLTTSIYAADLEYRFMHNDQDALIIGKVIKKTSEKEAIVEVSELICSSANMNTKSPARTIDKNINIIGESVKNIEEGENIAVAVDKSGTKYKVTNGLFKVTTNNTDTLKLVDSEYKSIEIFLNTRGKCTDFYMTEKGEIYLCKDTITYKKTDKDILIFDGEKYVEDIPTYYKNKKIEVEENEVNDIYVAIAAMIIMLFSYLVVKYKEKTKK